MYRTLLLLGTLFRACWGLSWCFALIWYFDDNSYLLCVVCPLDKCIPSDCYFSYFIYAFDWALTSFWRAENILQFSYNFSYLFIVFLCLFKTLMSILDIWYTPCFLFWKMRCKLCFTHSKWGCNLMWNEEYFKWMFNKIFKLWQDRKA